jgi:hypothetical protein
MDLLKDLFQAVLDCKSQTASDGAENGSAGPEKKAENNQDSDDQDRQRSVCPALSVFHIC